jgi:hypothetical protein
MDIAAACKIIRKCNDTYLARDANVEAASVVVALHVLKDYLENVRADGKPIHELDLALPELITPEEVLRVMPYVFSAESREAFKRRL